MPDVRKRTEETSGGSVTYKTQGRRPEVKSQPDLNSIFHMYSGLQCYSSCEKTTLPQFSICIKLENHICDTHTLKKKQTENTHHIFFFHTMANSRGKDN